MKKISVIIIFFSLIIIVSCSTVDKSVIIKDKKELKKRVRIAVMPFKDAPKFKGSGTAIADAITNELIKIKNFDLIERSQLSNIIKEQTMEAAGMTDGDLNSIGRLLKTDFIIVGSVSDYSYIKRYYFIPVTKLTFNVRIINIKKGNISGTARYSYHKNKRAWVGCCFFGWYFAIYSALSEGNINDDVTTGVREIVDEIQEQLEDD